MQCKKLSGNKIYLMRNYILFFLFGCLSNNLVAQTAAKLYGYQIIFQSGAAPVDADTVNDEKSSITSTAQTQQYLIYLTIPHNDKIVIQSILVKNQRFDFQVEKISQFPVEWPINKKQKKVLLPSSADKRKAWKIILKSPFQQKKTNSKNELILTVLINGKKQALVLPKLEMIEAYGM